MVEENSIYGTILKHFKNVRGLYCRVHSLIDMSDSARMQKCLQHSDNRIITNSIIHYREVRDRIQS